MLFARSVSSIMIAAFAPSGIGAPVTISAAVPWVMVICGGSPMCIVPVIVSFAGWFSSALKVSSAFTA